MCLPLLVLIVFATMEACTMLYVAQSLKVTAFEGARVGTVTGSETANVVFQCETLLDNRGVKDATVEMSPANPSALSPGDYFEVTVRAPFDSNSLLNGWMYPGKTIERSVVLRAE